MTPELSVNEQARLEAVRQLGILDTAAEPEFDELVHIAAAICDVPMSLISVLDEDRQWFKAAFGTTLVETPREQSFCAHTFGLPEPLIVENATADPRFAGNPLVTGQTGVRFYAGVPVVDPSGHSVGALCVLDTRPRNLTQQQVSALRILAHQVNARFELRLQRQNLERALEDAQRARTQLLASERRFAAFMKAAPFAAFIKDVEGRMLFCNRMLSRSLDLPESDALGKTSHELWPAERADTYRRHELQALASDSPLVTEEVALTPDGTISNWRVWRFRCEDEAANPLLGGIALDVTRELEREAALQSAQQELRDANRRLTALATVDPLTGLANRRQFDDRLLTLFREARARDTPLSVVMLDVDNFKQHNDLFGHAHGDEVLRSLGRCLRDEFRIGDLPARFGGEEFSIVLPNTSVSNALILCQRLLHVIRHWPWEAAQVTVSMGVCAIDPSCTDPAHLLARADEALYAAKRGGKDRVAAYAQAGHPAPSVHIQKSGGFLTDRLSA